MLIIAYMVGFWNFKHRALYLRLCHLKIMSCYMFFSQSHFAKWTCRQMCTPTYPQHKRASSPFLWKIKFILEIWQLFLRSLELNIKHEGDLGKKTTQKNTSLILLLLNFKVSQNDFIGGKCVFPTWRHNATELTHIHGTICRAHRLLLLNDQCFQGPRGRLFYLTKSTKRWRNLIQSHWPQGSWSSQSD